MGWGWTFSYCFLLLLFHNLLLTLLVIVSFLSFNLLSSSLFKKMKMTSVIKPPGFKAAGIKCVMPNGTWIRCHTHACHAGQMSPRTWHCVKQAIFPILLFFQLIFYRRTSALSMHLGAWTLNTLLHSYNVISSATYDDIYSTFLWHIHRKDGWESWDHGNKMTTSSSTGVGLTLYL